MAIHGGKPSGGRRQDKRHSVVRARLRHCNLNAQNNTHRDMQALSAGSSGLRGWGHRIVCRMAFSRPLSSVQISCPGNGKTRQFIGI